MAALNSIKKIGIIQSPGLKKNVPDFGVGDSVRVYTKISEEGKTRTQMFEGVVIRRSSRSISSTFTLRRVIGGEGVEKIFPVHSPNIDKIVKIKSGRVRRARLYYLRQKRGKGLKIERREQTKQETSATPENAPTGPSVSQ
jgi:large subunit ribosomal protein L19